MLPVYSTTIPDPLGITTGSSGVSFAGVYVTPSMVTLPSQGPVVMLAEAGAASDSHRPTTLPAMASARANDRDIGNPLLARGR